jgi:hypothetical protein
LGIDYQRQCYNHVCKHTVVVFFFRFKIFFKQTNQYTRSISLKILLVHTNNNNNSSALLCFCCTRSRQQAVVVKFAPQADEQRINTAGASDIDASDEAAIEHDLDIIVDRQRQLTGGMSLSCSCFFDIGIFFFFFLSTASGLEDVDIELIKEEDDNEDDDDDDSNSFVDESASEQVCKHCFDWKNVISNKKPAQKHINSCSTPNRY